MKIHRAFAVVVLWMIVGSVHGQTANEQPSPPPPDPAVVARDAAAAAAVNADAARNAANAAHGAAAAARAAVEAARKDADADHRDLLAVAATSAIVSFVALALLSRVLFQRKPQPEPQPEETEIERHLKSLHAKLDATLSLVDEKLQKTSDVVADRLSATPFVTPGHLIPISARINKLQDELARVENEVVEIATRPSQGPPPSTRPAADPVALERQVLGEWWKVFRANAELSAVFDSAAQDSAWDPLLRELTKVVPPDLKPTFDAVTAPCREHRIVIQKIGLVPRLVSGDAERLPTDAEELRRTREFADLLQSVQWGSDASSRLTFRYKSWVTDTFLPFADLYLQRYQQARLESRHADLQPGVTLVRQLLRIAAVEPIEVTPGETPFDSTRHIGRSTTTDPRFADGVITGVVRNGFIEGGQQVIRQPEVIVNRTR